MAETIIVKKLATELREIRKDLSFIKKHMFDPDSIMTVEESKRFEQSLKELKEGKTTSISDIQVIYDKNLLFVSDIDKRPRAY